jgi:hypothetical protein
VNASPYAAGPHALLRASRGPVVLIAMGFLFWLDQSEQVSFGRTWPVLLILIGVMKLLERVVSPPAPPLPPPVPPGPPMVRSDV